MCENILDLEGIMIEDGPIPEDYDEVQMFNLDGTPATE